MHVNMNTHNKSVLQQQKACRNNVSWNPGMILTGNILQFTCEKFLSMKYKNDRANSAFF